MDTYFQFMSEFKGLLAIGVLAIIIAAADLALSVTDPLRDRKPGGSRKKKKGNDDER